MFSSFIDLFNRLLLQLFELMTPTPDVGVNTPARLDHGQSTIPHVTLGLRQGKFGLDHGRFALHNIPSFSRADLERAFFRNRISAASGYSWHSTRRPDLAEVVRRRFVVSLSEIDAAQQIALPRTEQFVGQFRREIEVEIPDFAV